MKKRYRFLIILAVLAVGFYFVWPSIKWYFLTAQTDKDMAESSRNQIKVYAQERADAAIKSLLAMNASDPLPADYSFLVAKAKARYKTAGKSGPVGVDRAERPAGVLQPHGHHDGRRGLVPRPDVRPEGPEEPDHAARSRPAGRHVRHHPGRLRRLRADEQDRR